MVGTPAAAARRGPWLGLAGLALILLQAWMMIVQARDPLLVMGEEAFALDLCERLPGLSVLVSGAGSHFELILRLRLVCAACALVASLLLLRLTRREQQPWVGLAVMALFATSPWVWFSAARCQAAGPLALALALLALGGHMLRSRRWWGGLWLLLGLGLVTLLPWQMLSGMHGSIGLLVLGTASLPLLILAGMGAGLDFWRQGPWLALSLTVWGLGAPGFGLGITWLLCLQAAAGLQRIIAVAAEPRLWLITLAVWQLWFVAGHAAEPAAAVSRLCGTRPDLLLRPLFPVVQRPAVAAGDLARLREAYPDAGFVGPASGPRLGRLAICLEEQGGSHWLDGLPPLARHGRLHVFEVQALDLPPGLCEEALLAAARDHEVEGHAKFRQLLAAAAASGPPGPRQRHASELADRWLHLGQFELALALLSPDDPRRLRAMAGLGHDAAVLAEAARLLRLQSLQAADWRLVELSLLRLRDAPAARQALAQAPAGALPHLARWLNRRARLDALRMP